ncbi:MAG TPA: hypothetical protein VFV68_04100 [Agriterribacter sp.]|nr:hypothetical protein [Agriterribacter sp.]
MSLKNVKLPETVIANLYTTPLVCLTEAEPETPVPTTALKFLGSNQKQITIVVNTSEAPFLTDKSFNFLTGVLNACKLNMADVAVFNMHQWPDMNYNSVNTTSHPVVTLLFGVSPQEIGLPLQFPHFQVQRYNNVTYTWAPDLDRIEKDKLIKTQLWASLKTIFQLK